MSNKELIAKAVAALSACVARIESIDAYSNACVLALAKEAIVGLEAADKRVAELEAWNKTLADQNEKLATMVDDLESELSRIRAGQVSLEFPEPCGKCSACLDGMGDEWCDDRMAAKFAAKFAAPRVPECRWTNDGIDCGMYETTCGNAFALNDGTPESNGMKFCPYCSGKLVEAPQPSEKEE